MISDNKTKRDWAVWAAKKGFHVFPLIPNTKLPLIPAFSSQATNDIAKVEAWWTCPVLGTSQDYNVAYSTSAFGYNGDALIGVDIDRKNGKDGNKTILTLELEGYSLPPTFSQSTPSGGSHSLYLAPRGIAGGAGKLGEGVDILSTGRFVVGAGSTLNGDAYSYTGGNIVAAPEWLPQKVGTFKIEPEQEPETAESVEINQSRALARFKFYLLHEAPIAVEGQGGDETAYKVGAKGKDFGLGKSDTFNLMMEHWAPRCVPKWPADELQTKVENAYQYGKNQPGSAAPERHFTRVEPDTEAASGTNPIDEVNRRHAFVLSGSGFHILYEASDLAGRRKVEHLSEQTFHRKYAARKIIIDGKERSLTQLWMQHKDRRSYEGVCFRPGKDCPPEWYNLWKGFSVEPVPKGEAKHASLDAFLEHAEQNVCAGDTKLFRWLLGYFAHLIQKPYEKPLTALVFRGDKGVGKTALIERVGYLLGSHYLLSADKRYLTGNFNSHLENCLLLALDEAFWSGDKSSQGILKSLITGSTHLIERKGLESYAVENCTRVCIIGNEPWLVPASRDERRYAVFSVGEGRKQDTRFFHDMRVGMENGGYAHLLRYLLDFDLSTVDINVAPKTKGLQEQKLESLSAFEQFWFQCLEDGKIVGGDFEEEWPTEILRERFRDAYRRFAKSQNVRSRLESAEAIGRELLRLAPGTNSIRRRNGEEGCRAYGYIIPTLDECRKSWDRVFNTETEWL